MSGVRDAHARYQQGVDCRAAVRWSGTAARMRGSAPGPAPSECHDFEDGTPPTSPASLQLQKGGRQQRPRQRTSCIEARSQGVQLPLDLRLAEVNVCMPRVSATSNR
jgi:hypothetical protein